MSCFTIILLSFLFFSIFSIPHHSSMYVSFLFDDLFNSCYAGFACELMGKWYLIQFMTGDDDQSVIN